jgi:hypothetical protein
MEHHYYINVKNILNSKIYLKNFSINYSGVSMDEGCDSEGVNVDVDEVNLPNVVLKNIIESTVVICDSSLKDL